MDDLKRKKLILTDMDGHLLGEFKATSVKRIDEDHAVITAQPLDAPDLLSWEAISDG